MKGRILFVEDDTHVRAAYSLALTNAGYEVIPAGSIATALMHLDVIDLKAVVLDLRLPNGHGRRVIEELVAKRNDVPVVILSGTPDEHALGWPVVAALQKPTKRDPFLAAVNKATNATAEVVDKLRDSARRLKDCQE